MSLRTCDSKSCVPCRAWRIWQSPESLWLSPGVLLIASAIFIAVVTYVSCS